MRQSQDFRELLFADVALIEGAVSARHVAAALLKYWDRRERSETSLSAELAAIAGLQPEALAKLTARVDELVAASGGDPHLAVTHRGGLAHELHTAVSRRSADVSRELTQLGAGIRVTLRDLPKDRYLDFMPVGEGGMGIVYWAMDTELGRQVAFKVVRPPSAGPGAGVTPPAPLRMRAPEGDSEAVEGFEELKARFLQEAWVTGGMEHPGIVPVYELGRTEGGVPYYTMRFVRGQRTLQTAIEDVRGRPFEERIALLEPFLKVCDAMSYAHNRGVVHRDLKPANVALGEYGETLVLDWGLAKLTDHPDVHASRWQANVSEFRISTDMQTMTSALGTPGYMAPEAAAGDVANVDQLSDVYSLGAILFEIIAGRLPFEIRTVRAYIDQLLNEDAPDARSIDEAVPGSLAALCAFALARERGMRPKSVAALGEGVRSWQKQRAADQEVELLLSQTAASLEVPDDVSLAGMRRAAERSVVACQRVLELRPNETRAHVLLDRARELGESGLRAEEAGARRALLRKLGLGVLVATVLVGGVVAYLLDQRRQEAESAREVARTERDNASRHRARAEEAMGFITEDLREALEPEGRLDVLAQIGEKARAHYASIPIAGESAKSFRQRMRALRQLGEVYLAQGNLPRARAVFHEASEASRAALAAATGPLAQFEHDRASVNLARVDQKQGFARRGGRRLDAVLARLQGSRPAEFPALEWDELHVRALNARASSLRSIPDYERAREAAETSYTLATRMLEDEHARIDHRILAVETALAAASTRDTDGTLNEAVALAQGAVSDAKAMLGKHPKDLRLLALSILAASNQAWFLRYSGRASQAVVLLEEVLPEARRLVALRPDNYQWRHLFVAVLKTLGEARGGPKQEYAKGAAEFAEAFALAEALHQHDPSNAGYVQRLVTLCDRRAIAAGLDSDEALALRVRAVAYARLLSALEPDNARWRYTIGFTLGVLAGLTKDAGTADRMASEARDHTGYALERIPTAHDVSDFWRSLWYLRRRLAKSEEARVALNAETFDLQMRVARKFPDAYYAQHGVFYIAQSTAERFAQDPAAVPEATRQVAAALAWMRAQRERGDGIDALVARSLPSWLKRLEELAQD